MKKFLMFVFILGFTMPFIYGGCNGGGGGGNDGIDNNGIVPDAGDPPQIIEVRLFKVVDMQHTPTLTFTIGDMFNVNVHAYDPNADMSLMLIDQFLLPNIDAPYYPTVEFDLSFQSQFEMVFYLAEHSEVQGPAGDWRICFLIVDKMGNESNEFCVNTVIVDSLNDTAVTTHNSLYSNMQINNE